ncbi:unnamed protein product [Linum tenue]|uniref:Cobalamin-independent methionine synthase MetE C-terminal/archaeal domain-containing protein n=1 Tax=Linum tenue TaxID=586396 RepID=A0AAV0PGU8_9ROSI|nr:unnamed protein product [Linum tenue]
MARPIPLTLLNARMSVKSFKFWSGLALPSISLMLSKFVLIVPLSTTQAIRFQLLQAPPSIINFAGDLKYVVEHDMTKRNIASTEDLKDELSDRNVWIAASVHRGEEQGIAVRWTSCSLEVSKGKDHGRRTSPFFSANATALTWRKSSPRVTNQHETFFQIKLAIKDEVEYLDKAGINVIQIDEAALGEGLPLRKLEHAFYMDWVVHSFRITNCGVQDTTQVSITFLPPCSGKLFQVLWL